MALLYNKDKDKNPERITVANLNKKFIYNDADLKNAIIQKRASECHSKGGENCLEGANVYYNQYVAPMFNLPNTWQINEAAKIQSGNKLSPYGVSADSWDLAALLQKSGAIQNYAAPLYKNFPDGTKLRNDEKAAWENWNKMTPEDKKKLYSNLSLGSIVNFGDWGGIDGERLKGANEKAGLYPSRHSTRVIGFTETGTPILYDYGTITTIDHPKFEAHPITNITTPKEVSKYNYNYVKDWQSNAANKSELEYDPKEKLYLNKSNTRKGESSVTPDEIAFVEAINKNLIDLMQVSGASQEDVIKAGKVAFGILQNETRGGRDSFDAKTKEVVKPLWNAAKELFTLGYADTEEPSMGLTRIKPEMQVGDGTNKYSKYLKELGFTDPKKLNLWNPEQAALATTALVLSRKGNIEGVDNWYLKAQQHNTPAVGLKNEAYLKNADKDYANYVIENASRLYSPKTGQGLPETKKWMSEKKKEKINKNINTNTSIIKQQLNNVSESTNVKKPLIVNIQKQKHGGLIYKHQKGNKFNDWYKTVPLNKNDTSSYNLRRAYELAPKEDLNAFVNNPEAHLLSAYKNPKTGIYEFMKSKDHPTVQKELEWFNSNDPEAIQFRKDYYLDNSKDYYQYIPKYKKVSAITYLNK